MKLFLRFANLVAVIGVILSTFVSPATSFAADAGLGMGTGALSGSWNGPGVTADPCQNLADIFVKSSAEERQLRKELLELNGKLNTFGHVSAVWWVKQLESFRDEIWNDTLTWNSRGGRTTNGYTYLANISGGLSALLYFVIAMQEIDLKNPKLLTPDNRWAGNAAKYLAIFTAGYYSINIIIPALQAFLGWLDQVGNVGDAEVQDQIAVIKEKIKKIESMIVRQQQACNRAQGLADE